MSEDEAKGTPGNVREVVTTPTKAQSEVIDYLRAHGVDERVAAHRAINLGLTMDDIEWNERLGRPVEWKETLDIEAEDERRRQWTEQHG